MINLREWALPIYTILMEVAGGTLFLLWIARALLAKKLGRQAFDQAIQNSLWIILLTTVVSLVGSHFHLSKPYYSFLAILNIRNSWLSREIAFSLLFLFLILSLCWLQDQKQKHWHLKSFIGWTAILLACANTYAMSRIYFLPTQPIWNSLSTIFSFYGSTLLLGSVVLIALLVLDLKYSEINNLIIAKTQKEILHSIIPWSALATVIFSLTMFFLQTQYYQNISQSTDITIQASFTLLRRFYLALFFLRSLLMLVGASSLIISVSYCYSKRLALSWLLIPSYVSCLIVMTGEILSRFLFYALHIRIGL